MKLHSPVLLRKSSQYEHTIDTDNRYFINHKADIQKLFILKPIRQLAGTPSKHKPGTVLNKFEPLYTIPADVSICRTPSKKRCLVSEWK